MRHAPRATLGDVLHGNGSKTPVKESGWVELVRCVAAGDQLALHAIYERAHRAVFTLAVRITGNVQTAEEVTVDVFYQVWRRASAYDPANGTVLGWVMIQARTRAIDRVRFEQRKRRNGGMDEAVTDSTAADPRDVVELKQQAAALRAALVELTADERRAIESAFFSGLTHAEVAVLLGQPLGTVKTRIRSGLQKLRVAMAAGGGDARSNV